MSRKTVSSFKRRQRARLLFKIVLTLLVFSAVFGFSSLSIERAFKIEDISISGASRVDENKLAEAVRILLDGKKAFFLSEANPFFFDAEELTDYLKKEFPAIEDISAERDFLEKRLILTLSERKGWAVWCAKSCYYLDNQGVLFQPAPQFFGGLILKITDERPQDFNQGGQILDGSFFASFKKFIEDAEKTGKTAIRNIKITPNRSFWLESSAGWKIFIDEETNLDKAVENLGLFLDSEAFKNASGSVDYIDLRFPDKGFLKIGE